MNKAKNRITVFKVILGLRPRPAALHRIGRSPARTCAGTFFEFLARPSAFILCCAMVAGSAMAQQYPTKPVRIIVTSLPGSGPDVISRVLGAKLAEVWRQQVIIDNRAGASGRIGAEIASLAAPDGY
ncbi:MAG: hypothetical protein HYS46_05185, partial [Betaproteobacteria bacterium]|nr:hypothetical protein [Betaproteobacteria bacterium]